MLCPIPAYLSFCNESALNFPVDNSLEDFGLTDVKGGGNTFVSHHLMSPRTGFDSYVLALRRSGR